MTRQTKRRNNHGFTLAETLLVVGILVVLFALAMIPITKMQRDIRQTELDSKAEVVFMAAQNRLTQLQAAGQMSAYNENYTAKLGLQPIDAESGKYSDDDLVYVTSKEKGDSSKAAAWILPESRLEADLWNADWVVEYDPASASVYAVFYSEKDMNYEPTGFNMLRARDTRLSRGAKVGYYGGDSVATKDTDELTPQFEIVNGERLLLTGSCDMAMLAELKFYVTLEDESGHVTDAITLKSPEVKLVGSTYNVEMVLDDLTEKDNMRFAEQTRFKDKTSGAHLVPGEQLKITVKVVSASSQVGTAVSTLETNSLFAAVADQRQRRSGAEGRTATVSCARHLQNLDKDSGVTDTTGRNTATVNAAVQDQDILFVSTTDDGWDSCYPGQTFTPIDNTNLTSYDATLTVGETSVHPVIYDLPVETDGDAGLFAALNSTAELHHICLAGAQISGKGNVGAMIGATKGKLTIDHCQVLLSQLKGHVNGKNETDVWISGATVGGLVGEITSGTVTVENSFAASVLSGTDRAGGLIGNIAGAAVTVKNSYADCYLYSDASTGRTGGLVGGYKDTSSLNMENCYAAGFQQASTTAGLVADALYTGDSVSNTYTACAPLAGEQLTFSTTVKPTDAVSPKFSKVFYLCTAETDMAGTSFVNASQWTGANNRAAAAELLGDAFTAETGGTNTVPYNLMENMGLGAYSYPKLKDIPHYGDWQTEFESGSLAYYEYYADKSYGFYGGGLSTLDNTKTVLGDGYGVVYEGSVPEAPSVKDADGNAVTLQTAQKIVSGEKTYYLLPLPAEMVNTGAPGSTYYRQVQVEGVPYYYNPHFARSVTTGTTMPDAPDEIYIRTARQLNNLSLYYDQYSKMLSANAGFLQGRSIDYASYDWKNFGLNGTAVKEQQPIGRSEAQPFRHTYNGGRYEITGISFLTRDNDRYTGMFGYNTGSLSNIALTGDDERTAGISVAVQRMTAGAGALAGWNAGQIYNCAASGYRLDGDAYSGSTYYLGGLVGYNAGTIRSSGVSSPGIAATATYATVRAGGFVGANRGQIRQSYAFGVIQIPQIRDSKVALAGFAAENRAGIRNSYCAMALSSMNADTYGFAPESGSISGCYYLSGGTYAYCGEVYLYDNTTGTAGASPVTKPQLEQLAISGFGRVDAQHTLHHPNTEKGVDGVVFPYPAVVSAADGRTVYYGDWPTDVNMGKIGVVYWEHEEGGSNAGYRISFLGYNGSDRVSGSNLCTEHDDGGAVREYGYGYYWLNGEDTPSEPTATVDGGNFVLGNVNQTASDRLAAQIVDYHFVLYQTGVNGMRLETYKAANGAWALTQNGKTYHFSVCPFFANAFNYMDGTTGTDAPGTANRAYAVRSVEQLQFINWSYVGSKGSADEDVTGSNYYMFPYLQYKTTDTDGTNKQTKDNAIKGNDKGGARPIQSWAQTHDVNGTGLGSPDLVEDTDNATKYGGYSGYETGASQTEPDGDTSTPAWKSNAKVHPIAGAVDRRSRNSSDSYAVNLYNWFGGSYDGQNYYIKNICINSYCYNVGLFGTTAGATIRNIVLYSDNDSVIQRSSLPTSWKKMNAGSETDPRRYATSYALGGLVGIAYDYDSNMGNGLIENCALAGYTIQDNSKNKQALGEAVVGGLIGVSNVDLKNCSSVAQIEINCTHFWDELKTVSGAEKKEMNGAKWGNFIRVGGLVGGLRDRATNCYTGGKITVSDATLAELNQYGDSTNTTLYDGTVRARVKTSGNNDNNQNPSTHVFVGGIGGSGFSASFINFTNSNNSGDGKPHYENCYTYINLPDMKGTIEGIAIIGSAADRFNTVQKQVELVNCYYLEGTTDNIDFTGATKTYISNKRSLYDYFNDKINGAARQKQMLLGHMAYAGTCLWNNGSNATITGLTGLTYDQMSSRVGSNLITTENTASPQVYNTFLEALNQNKDSGSTAKDGFGWVTIEENSASIHGKYSFPGSDLALRGQDYPFPTVLTQEASDGKVNLHYGAWPKVGLFWSEGVVTLDMIADYDDATGLSKLDLKLLPENIRINGDTPTFAFSNDGIVSVDYTPNATKGFDVVLTGLQEGATEVTATIGNYTARLMVTVTADMNVSATPNQLSLYEQTEAAVTLAATDKNGKSAAQDKLGSPVKLTWQITSADSAIAAKKGNVTDNHLTVQALSKGDTVLYITAVREQKNGTFRSNTVLYVTVHRQGVLGIASPGNSGTDPQYREGVLKSTLDGWQSGPANATYESGAPEGGEGVDLFLYGIDADAALGNFTVTKFVITDSGKTEHDMTQKLDGTEQDGYSAQLGSVSTSGDTSVLPLTVKGRKEEKVTVSVTLRDTRNAADYTLDIPYTIRNLMPYTVQYMNDGVVVDSAEVLEGETLKLPSWPGMFSGYGNRYAFKGWYIKDGDGTFYAKGSDYTVTSDVIFEAAWLRAFNVYITGKGSTVTLTSNHDYIPAYEFSQTKYAANTKFTIQIQQTYLPGTAENPKITLKDDQYTAEYRNGTWYFTIPQSTFGTTYTTHPT